MTLKRAINQMMLVALIYFAVGILHVSQGMTTPGILWLAGGAMWLCWAGVWKMLFD